MKKKLKFIFSTITAAIFLLQSSVGLRAQDEETSVRARLIFGNGIVSPASPEASSMVQYGSMDDVDLYTGTAVVGIPIYEYSDDDFTIPVSLLYSSNGYRPNAHTGVLGLGWNLNAGGAVTREVHGIMDDAWADLELYNFRSKWHGKFFTRVDPVSVYGYAFLHDVTQISELGLDSYDEQRYEHDYVLQGKSGSEYMKVLKFLDFDLMYGTDYCFETEPDVFHFSMPGHTGSFILRPGGGYMFFDTSGPSLDYELEVGMDRSGFVSFTITDGMKRVYEFSRREMCTSIYSGSNDNGLSTPGSWRLTRIDAPNGRSVQFEYGTSYHSSTVTPIKIVDKNGRWTYIEYGSDNSLPDFYDYVNVSGTNTSTTESGCLTGIRVMNSDGGVVCSIDLDYSPKATELGSSEQAQLKLDGIRVMNADGDPVRSCSMSYVMDGGRDEYEHTEAGVTFLSSVTLSGEGRYSFDYHGRSRSLPGMGTWQTDWYGYWNHVVSSGSYMPSLEQVRGMSSTRPWLNSLRQPNVEDTKAGMLTKVTWPTGGWTCFRYEQNSFGEDRTNMSSIHAGSIAGLRLSGLESYDIDSRLVQRRDYEYQTEGGMCSGRLLWRPELYCRYGCQSSGYCGIHRETLSSTDDYDFSGRSFIEYPRVVESIHCPESVGGRSIIVHEFYDSVDGQHDNYVNPSTSITRHVEGSDTSLDWEYIVGTTLNIASPGGVLDILNNRHIACRAGKPKTVTECDGDVSNVVRRTTWEYLEVSNGEAVLSEEMIVGHPCGFSRSHLFPELHEMETVEYGSSDHTDSVSRRMVQYEYDENRRLLSELREDGMRGTIRKEYSYHDAVPELLTSSLVYRGGIPCSGERYSYVRPDADRYPLWYAPAAMSRRGSDARWHTVRTFSDHNSAGKPCTVTDACGAVTRYAWDDTLMNLTSASVTATPTSAPMTTTWTWKPLVGVTSVTFPSGRTQAFTYDSAGRLVESRENSVPVQRYEYHVYTENE